MKPKKIRIHSSLGPFPFNQDTSGVDVPASTASRERWLDYHIRTAFSAPEADVQFLTRANGAEGAIDFVYEDGSFVLTELADRHPDREKVLECFRNAPEALPEWLVLEDPHALTASELRSRRQALGLSQKELAEKLGVSQTTITRWERDVPIQHPVILDRAIRDLEREHEASRDASTWR